MFQRTTLGVASFLTVFSLFAQDYTSYQTGSITDVVTNPEGGVCLMGGATEDDNAMIWFLNRANGGDVLVLRASGSDGYNDYLYTDLGVSVNSVETIVFNNANASNIPYIHQKINQAEAIWFAGGDQYDYISYWRNTAIDSLINKGIEERNIVIGGTSAGMAIQGGYYFSAQNGTITSDQAMSNPYANNLTVDSTSFLKNEFLDKVITDTHYDDPDRKGRHATFLAKILGKYGVRAYGIACDEYTAVCVGTDGIASVYGGYPSYDDNAYFLTTNCELSDVTPEVFSNNTPVTWDLNNKAMAVYQVKGTAGGTNNFDLNTWMTGNGGTWNYWYINNGSLYEAPTTQPDCALSLIKEKTNSFEVYPNPANNEITLEGIKSKEIQVINQLGQIEITKLIIADQETLDISTLTPGVYFLQISGSTSKTKLIIQ